MADEIVSYRASDGMDVDIDAKTVRSMMISGADKVTDAEVATFLMLCRARGLNPLARDAYLVKYREDSPASVVVSKDYYTRAASQQATYRGKKAGVVVVKADGSLEYREGALVGGSTERLVGGWAEVYDSRRDVPERSVVSIGEYSTGKAMWASKPATMIRKCAVVQALREAYPAVFAGLYDSAEMGEMPVEYEEE